MVKNVSVISIHLYNLSRTLLHRVIYFKNINAQNYIQYFQYCFNAFKKMNCLHYILKINPFKFMIIIVNNSIPFFNT